MTVKKFRFEAIAKDGKILSGFLFSETKKTARAKLTEEGMAVLTLEPYMEQKQQTPGFHEFEFKALGPRSEEIRGNIEAKTMYAAYRKLRTEYDFQLAYLVPKNLPFEEKEELKKQGINAELEELFQEDINSDGTSKTKKKIVAGDNEKMLVIIEARKKQMQFFRKEIDFLLDKVQTLIRQQENILTPAERRNLQEKLNNLSRLRQSNSTKHLEMIMRQIFEDLRTEKIFLPLHDQIPEYESRRQEFLDLAKLLEDRLDKGLATVDVGTLNPEAIRTTVKRLRLPERIGTTLYWTNAFLLAMMLVFWLINIFKLFLGYDIERAQFYFSSSLFWFMTGLSAIITFLFAWEVFSPRPFHWIKKSILYSAALLILFFFYLEFPVLFFWI
ncbi:hypothetical protein K9M59_01935 [Candidatus Gracilibacteria bacterium]|nr:hypothetical protein [Candidatus Gracilibacteria bacterium]MCF7819608.1 hypothetical protein [Candidatus Gracilibacteria bacterium]